MIFISACPPERKQNIKYPAVYIYYKGSKMQKIIQVNINVGGGLKS